MFYIYLVKQEVLMSKKKKNNPVQSYILAIKSMSLASGMMVFGAACDSIKKELINRITKTVKEIINLV